MSRRFDVRLFQFLENIPGPFDDIPRNSRKPGNVNTVTFIRRTGNDFVQKRNVVLLFPYRNV